MSDLKSKILAIIGRPVLGALASLTEEGKPWTRYIVPLADKDLNIRFATYLGSRKVKQLQARPDVHLSAGDNTLTSMGTPYLQIAGTARVSTDPGEKKAFWNDNLKAYFSGPDDPNYCVVIIKPSRIEYMTFESSSPEVWTA
jgi:general stress protein 26